jgi:zinc resistance-associated protein
MKKPLVVTLATISLVLIGSLALACWEDGYWGWGGPGRGHGGGYYSDVNPGYQNFLNDTANLREELAAKQGEYNALMTQSNPDPKRAAQLSQEIARLNEQLRVKAQSFRPGPGSHGGAMGPYCYDYRYGGRGCW